jgi:hypothetical protein
MQPATIEHLRLDGVEAGVGSSRISRAGSVASAIAMATRCCMPRADARTAHDGAGVGDLDARERLRALARLGVLAAAEDLGDLLADPDRGLRAAPGSGTPSTRVGRGSTARTRQAARRPSILILERRPFRAGS